ncbi:hypothetical protein [Bacillus thuringiensis]|uniref:hypothetical protein n=1 Tax=Bacillus thuringiensis TaxID=1428 RepID=UPI000BFB9E35|nr:hypothetical protein [Bacillus thuringiensis]PGT89903.1 hypothetical protein COD17_09130 [Bacillus thuringiensis]
MGLFESWAKKNKRDSSSRVGSSMLGALDSLEESQNTLQVNIGAGGLLDTGTTSKESRYRELRTKISDETLVLLESVFKMHKTRPAIFRRLEDEGVPLTYLVALDITTEEDVQSYLTLKERGLDVNKMGDNSRLVEYDEVYAREILAGAEEYPALVDTNGNPVQVVRPVREIKMAHDIEKHITTQEQVEPTQPAPSNEDVPPIEEPTPTGVVTDTAHTEQTEEPTGLGWESMLQEIIAENEADAQQEKEEVETQEVAEEVEAEVEEEAENPAMPRVKEVYLLADNVSIPKLDGYEFFVVRSAQDFNNFTTHRDNLLIITKQVPKRLSMMFLNWLKGVKRCGDKYRVATLKTSAIHHEIVEAELELTQESLDNYFATRDAKSYVGSGVGTFMNISSRLTGFDD